MSEPLISVVTPCHNAAPFVGETLESVLAQTHPRVEHVVVDDGSCDGSWEIVERYGARHPERIRAVRLGENRGASHARNRGVEVVQGEYLMFLDADDLISPETLASLLEAARREPGSLAVCEWGWLRKEDGGWVEIARDLPFRRPTPTPRCARGSRLLVAHRLHPLAG